MTMPFHEAVRVEGFISLTLVENTQALTSGMTTAVNPHTRVTNDLSFGGPCSGTVGRVIEELHGQTNPQVVTVVRCEANGCKAAFFPTLRN